jgi:phosphatidylinositol alpha-1,6-mannosyltransferase
VIVANSLWTASLCRRVFDELQCGEVDERVRVIPLGTDPARFRPDLDPRKVREAYGLPDGRWLLTVARLVPHKGIDTGIRCLASLTEKNSQLRYLVVGAGSDKARLEALARDLQVMDRVHFLGEVQDKDLPALYNVADLYLAPSRFQALDAEGFGISILEASASGLPVVVGRSGGTADAVREGETGILVDPEDPRSFAAAVRSLLEDDDRAVRMGREGRRVVETFYNWDRVVGKMREIGRECARSYRDPAR